MLLKNRSPKDIFYVSSDIVSLVVIHLAKFNMIPVVNSPSSSETELDLLEKYVYRVKLFKPEEVEAHMKEAFGFLFKTPYKNDTKNFINSCDNDYAGNSNFSFGNGTGFFKKRVRKIVSRTESNIESGKLTNEEGTF